MFYKLTLLKDLPGIPAGTQFSYRHGYYHIEQKHFSKLRFQDRMCIYGSDKMSMLFPLPEEIIDDPEWIKKEVDHDKLVDLACPVCGETKVDMSFETLGVDKHIFLHIEYACGHYNGRWGRYLKVFDYAEDLGEYHGPSCNVE